MVKPLGPAVARTLLAVRMLASMPIAKRINVATKTGSPQAPFDCLPMNTMTSAPAHVAVTMGQLVARPVYTACSLGPATVGGVMSAP